MSPVFVDSHAHLDDGAFDPDRDEVLARAEAAGVARVVNIGYRPERWRTSGALSARHPAVALALGLHPHHADGFDAGTVDALAAAIDRYRASAVGEIGLDFFRPGPDAETQHLAFRAQIELARRLGLPIVIHQRAAEDALIEVLAGFSTLPPLVLHSFDGSDRLAAFALERGFGFGVGGLATRAGAEALRRTLGHVPLDSILLETDSPYLVPSGVKARRNEPSHVPQIAAKLAPIWNVEIAEVADRTTAAAGRFFRFDPVVARPPTAVPS